MGRNAFLNVSLPVEAAVPAAPTALGKNNLVSGEASASDKASTLDQASASDTTATTILLEDVKPEDVKYKIVNLGGFPIALHTNWFLELEVTNSSSVPVSATDMQVELLLGDFSKLPLTLYDPKKSYQEGLFLHVVPLSTQSYTIKAHIKKVFYAYFFDSDLISNNYRGQAHRPDGLIVTAGSKRVAILTTPGF